LYRQNAGDLSRIAAAPKDWPFAALAVVLVSGSNLIMFARWYVLVRAQEFSFRLRDAVRYGFAGLATNFIAPGTVGGDLLKAGLLARDQTSRRAAAAATVVLDRLLGVVGLLLVGTVATLVPHDFPESPAVKANTALLWTGSVGGLVAVGLMLVPATTGWSWVARLPRLPLVGPILGELIQGVKQYQSRPGAVLAALGLALVNNAGSIVGLYCCARALQPAWVPGLAAHFYFRPSAELFGAASMIPGGIGALEFAIREAYVLLNPGVVSDAEAAAAGFSSAIAFRAVTVSVSMIGLCLYLVSRGKTSQAMEEAARGAA
jgi:uncharacterized membrane protein YbhN (UPF0104 family)